METLALLKRALKAAAEVLGFGAGIQKAARQQLISDLHSICGKCEDAYGAVLLKLRPVKDSFNDANTLSIELRNFATDVETRDRFKPERLCGEVDSLLDSLANNMDSLKYSIEWNRITSIRATLNGMGSYDAAIYASYDEFARGLDNIAGQLTDPSQNIVERMEYAKRVVSEFEVDLRSAIDDMRISKDTVLRGESKQLEAPNNEKTRVNLD
jgi:hypothetical protein